MMLLTNIRSVVSPNSQSEKLTFKMMHSSSLLIDSETQKQSVSVAEVLVKQNYREKSRRTFFSLVRDPMASPTRLKLSAGIWPLNSSFSEERLVMLARLLQIMAMLLGFVCVLLRKVYKLMTTSVCCEERTEVALMNFLTMESVKDFRWM